MSVTTVSKRNACIRSVTLGPIQIPNTTYLCAFGGSKWAELQAERDTSFFKKGKQEKLPLLDFY